MTLKLKCGSFMAIIGCSWLLKTSSCSIADYSMSSVLLWTDGVRRTINSATKEEAQAKYVFAAVGERGWACWLAYIGGGVGAAVIVQHPVSIALVFSDILDSVAIFDSHGHGSKQGALVAVLRQQQRWDGPVHLFAQPLGWISKWSSLLSRALR